MHTFDKFKGGELKFKTGDSTFICLRFFKNV